MVLGICNQGHGRRWKSLVLSVYAGPIGFQTHPKMFRLSYLTVLKFWIEAETPQNPSEIDRDRFVPVCGNRPVILGLASSSLDS